MIKSDNFRNKYMKIKIGNLNKLRVFKQYKCNISTLHLLEG